MKQSQRNLNQELNKKLMRKMGGFDSPAWKARKQKIARRVQKTIENQQRMAEERRARKANQV